ncbi:MAG: C10 family peptidase [Candidatus Zixiibacteriota bacterium]
MTHSRLSLFRLALLPVILLVLSSFSFAELATESEMEQVCRNYLAQSVLQRGDWQKSTTPDILESHEILSDNGVVLARYYSIDAGGFVLVPALKEMRPIKAYSDTYTLDEQQEGGFLLMIKEVLQSRFDMFEQAFGSLDARQSGDVRIFAESQRDVWDEYTLPTDKFLAVRAAEKDYIEEAGPLTVSSWHQREPYNHYCPMGDGGRTVVGCVATATAQILYYWQWPPEGIGSHTYFWNGDQSCEGTTDGEILTASYSDSYDWAHIIDSCDDGCSAADTAAMAELCYEVGVAFEMNYGACGSAASTSYAATVFPTYFKYSLDIVQENRTNYSLTEWYNIIKEEIDNGRVGQYRIRSHSIVADGYRTDGLQYEYHMNYGWGNSFNAWYVLDSLYCSWVEGDICPADEEFVITHIHPQYDPILHPLTRTIDEFAGDGDGYCDGGDTMDMAVTIENLGGDATNANAQLTTADPFISIINGTMFFDSSIPWGGQSSGATAFRFVIDPSCPDPHYAMLIMTISADGGYLSADTQYILVGNTAGFEDDMESGEGYWTHGEVLPTFDDEWHIETYRSHSGTTSWKVGGPGEVVYANGLDAGLKTPLFMLPSNAQLSFWHWMDAEIGSAATAWDGAIVMFGTGDGTWTQITPDGGYPYTIIENAANPFDTDTPCLSGTHDWEYLTFDLSAFSGVGQILFRFGSDGAVAQEGWYVDDIQIVGTGYVCGDANGDSTVNVGDAVYLINYIFKSGPSPIPEEAGDADGGGSVNVGDAVYLINHIFNGGPAPVCP